MFLEFLNMIGTILEFLKYINGKSSQSGRVPLIYLEILMLCIEIKKILKKYTYIHFIREHSSVFNLKFSIFLFNQTGTIANIQPTSSPFQHEFYNMVGS